MATTQPDPTKTEYQDAANFIYSSLDDELRRYHTIRLNNYAATIQAFPELWDLFIRLDTLIREEFDASGHLSSSEQLLPRMLFTHSHSVFRIAMELAFSTCVHEAASIMRTGVESAVVAYKLFRNPELTPVWMTMSLNATKTETAAFTKAFRAKKKEQLFTGLLELERLHKFWQESSELAAHSNIGDLSRRTVFQNSPEARDAQVHYFERDKQYVVLYTQQLLHVMRQIEGIIYKVFEPRLNLHPTLNQRRKRFDELAQEYRAKLIKEWKLKPDGSMG